MTLFLLKSSPYGSDVVYHGLRLAGVMAQEGKPIRVFLMADATGAAISGQAGANDDANLGNRLANLIALGVEVRACGMCLETRGYHNAGVVDGVRVSGLPDLSAWITESDQVLTF